jgi:hypothetical protein
MAKKQPGTFADLYDVEQSVHTPRAGRPRRKSPRKQVTLYLTQEQEEALADLHHTWRKQFKVDRSDITGLALEAITTFSARHNELSNFQDFESLKVHILKQLQDGTKEHH